MRAVAPFYTGSRQDPQGLERRRRFQLDRLRLLGIVEDVFGGTPATVRQLPDVTPEQLPDATPEQLPDVTPEQSEERPLEPHVVDAILTDMDRARGAEMRDIVATIEARQYELMSDALEGLLVIQGGPGSGKTAIALHRAAWLLYNYQEELGRTGVLVVGPNRAFMEYVAAVLPSLGESAVVQSSIDRLPDLGDVRVRATERTEAARVKGDVRMAAIVQRAVAARVRVPEEDVTLTVGRIRPVLPADHIKRIVGEAWSAGRTYLGAREVFRRELVVLAHEHVGERRGLFRSGPDPAEVEMAVTGTGGALERIWPTVTAPQVVRDLLASKQRLAAAAAGSLTDEESELLRRSQAGSIRQEPWTAADIPLLDEADALVRGVSSSYGYVLADEAQDLSPMQLRMILRRSTAGRATLVGDIAQATGAYRCTDWLELLDATGFDTDPRIAELAVGYRVPRQIMELAAELIPRIAPDTFVPRAVRLGPEDPRVIAVEDGGLATALVAEVTTRVDGERTVGVIAPAGLLEDLRGALAAAGMQAGDILTDGLARTVTVLSADQAKGLEFDHVVVVEPAAIAGAAEEWAYVYIALTRATRTLSVLHTTPAPFERPPVEPDPEPEPATPAPELIAIPVPEPAGIELTARYTEALLQAKFLHAGQRRRGTPVPYLAHLQAVAALVLEDGGSEDEAIAALLHDAAEDHGAATLDRIAEHFGVGVARIVLGCTDPEGEPDASWRERKRDHLRELESAGPEVRRVALAEKLDNARALLRDYRRIGDRLWTRMAVDPEDILWYQEELADLFVAERPGDMASELQDAVDRLLELASEPG
ncbi:HD domain-containing protein [Candidatus Solirubrobacter pratensis]|uniref:HD domain-containing protein n=1 Tax=Candidatus Solirubrobacter pratensis TaxID=1298857 RepID=UPI0012DF2298|nr:HD domain-containing protein [Candidatus Solirubrobacter pratensis]